MEITTAFNSHENVTRREEVQLKVSQFSLNLYVHVAQLIAAQTCLFADCLEIYKDGSEEPVNFHFQQ